MNELPAELVDIVEPAPAAIQGSQAAQVIVITVVLLIGAFVITRWWLKNQDRRRTLRQLRRLRLDFSAGRVTSRALAYAVASELRNHLQTNRLNLNHPVAARDDTQRAAWHDFITRLDILRYQPDNALNPAQIDAVVREAADWARR